MKLSSILLALATFAVAGLSFNPPALAQGRLLEVYVAYLGPDDHYNSRGTRLSEPWQVVRQDRANFHRFGIRDRGDEDDRFFASAANRARMERMILNGYIEGDAGWRIVNDNCWVRVEIYSDSVHIKVK
ncbi:hypothetical protein C8N35_11024 [Breoghania corrubedonensis]|uniref:Uncharacterized protein n=1 Tax=Breoghania corrubedonensis TaxID=665038 RepID=A0A2T5V1A9_9HYPH|nr:hypothetical protein [Breoghania corrubedonensis]PTW57545.1 hypothetical protein C8N35_11024 [Breoghania corrubedonensis]